MQQQSVLPMSPSAGYAAQKHDIDGAIARVLERGRYILAEEVTAFEREFGAYIGCAGTIGVASGTDAISLALRALAIRPGDGVVTVSHTAVATVAGIALTGAVPVLVDIDESTFTMKPDALESAMCEAGRRESRLPTIKAIVPVHLYGHMADMNAIRGIARRHGVPVIEDCAQAHGAAMECTDPGLESGSPDRPCATPGSMRRAGSLGDLAAFSFYPTKNLGALGDGGCVMTSNGALGDRARSLREYGWRERYISHDPGMNSRLDELQAAILRVKLRNLEQDNARRREIASFYGARLGSAGVALPIERQGFRHVYHQYVVRVPRRDEVRASLAGSGIMTMIHYPVPVHLQPAYRDASTGEPRGVLVGPGGLPVTERVCREIVSLPMYPQLCDEDVVRVVECLLKCT